MDFQKLDNIVVLLKHFTINECHIIVVIDFK